MDLLTQQKAQLQQAQQSRRAKETQKEQDASQEKPENRDIVALSTQQAFISIGAADATAKKLGLVRTRAVGELRMAESDSFLADPDPEAAAKARGKISMVDGIYGRCGR